MNVSDKKLIRKGLRLIVLTLLMGLTQTAFGASDYNVIDLKGGLDVKVEGEFFLNNESQVVCNITSSKEIEPRSDCFTYSREKGVGSVNISAIDEWCEYENISILDQNDQGVIIGKLNIEPGLSEPLVIYPEGSLILKPGFWEDDVKWVCEEPSLNNKGHIVVTAKADPSFWGMQISTWVFRRKPTGTGTSLIGHSNDLFCPDLLPCDGLPPKDFRAKAINNRGQILFVGANGFAIFDKKSGKLISCWMKDESVQSVAVSCFNDDGVVLGQITQKNTEKKRSEKYPFLYDRKHGLNLRTDIRLVGDNIQPISPELNKKGEFIDVAIDEKGNSYGFLYSNGCVQFDLFCMPIALNNKGEVLLRDISVDHCYLWSKEEGKVSLQSLIHPSESFWRIERVFQLNDFSEVLALAYNQIEGDYHIVLLTPRKD